MKETTFLVHLNGKGYIKNVTEDGEWLFTNTLNESLKFRTITGAYIRLVESKKISKLSNLNSSIVVVEFYDEGKFKVVSKLDYIQSKQRGRPKKEETEVSSVDTVEQPKRGRGRPPKKKDETVSEQPKRGRGRPRKNPIPIEDTDKPKRGIGRPPKKVVLPEVDETKVKKLNEGVDEPKKRRGRPPKQNRTIEGFQSTDELENPISPKKTANKVHTNHLIQDTSEEPLVKKKEIVEEETPETKIVESDLNVKIVKTSTEDSFWD